LSERIANRLSVGSNPTAACAIRVSQRKFPELADEIVASAVTIYQPYWVVRAHLLDQLGRKDQAFDAFDRAIGLTEDVAVWRFLLDRRA